MIMNENLVKDISIVDNGHVNQNEINKMALGLIVDPEWKKIGEVNR